MFSASSAVLSPSRDLLLSFYSARRRRLDLGNDLVRLVRRGGGGTEAKSANFFYGRPLAADTDNIDGQTGHPFQPGPARIGHVSF
jgi:hypothetical protein